MPLFLCHVHLSVPTSTYHLLSDTASVERAAESSIDKGRVVLHQFSSSVKSIVIGKSHCNSWCHCYIVPFEGPLTSVRLKYKWFVQPKLHQEISFWHVAMFPNVLHGALHCLSCVLSVCYVFFWARPDIVWKGGAGIKISFRRFPQFDREGFRRKTWHVFWNAPVSFPCSFWLFLLNISSFEKYCKCWTSHFVVHICSFHLFLFVVLVLKAGVNRSCW